MERIMHPCHHHIHHQPWPVLRKWSHTTIFAISTILTQNAAMFLSRSNSMNAQIIIIITFCQMLRNLMWPFLTWGTWLYHYHPQHRCDHYSWSVVCFDRVWFWLRSSGHSIPEDVFRNKIFRKKGWKRTLGSWSIPVIIKIATITSVMVVRT